MLENTNTNNISFLSQHTELAYNVLGAFIMSAVLVMQLFPAKALAYTNWLAAAQTQEFPRAELSLDPTLPLQKEFAQGDYFIVTASAYTSTVEQTDGNPFMTASGTQVQPGVVAANFLPFGTKLLINGRIYTVADRLNSRYNGQYRIDIWFNDISDAFRFGVRPIGVEIVSLP